MSASTTQAVRSPQKIAWGATAMCFLAVLLDGFDTAALAVVIPTMSKEWGVEPAAFTLPLVLTNVGVVIGYVSAGWLGARVRGRELLAAGVAFIGVTTLLVAVTLALQSIAVLTVLRFVTGIGLGLVLPAAVATATSLSPEHRRTPISVMVTLGLAGGATIGGLFGRSMLTAIGTDGIFWLAGAAALVLTVILMVTLPRQELHSAVGSTPQDAKVSRLFGGDLKLSTGLVWAFAFLTFISAYTLQSWVPTLLTGYGFDASDAPIGLAYVSIGGIVGGIVLVPLSARIGIVRALALLPAIGALGMVIAARAGLDGTGLLLSLAVAGLGVTAGQIGQLALAVALYDVGARTTGVGWAAAMGRLGSIVGPATAGVLLGLSLPARDIVLLNTVPILVAVTCVGVLWWRRGGGLGSASRGSRA